ncbi:MAG: YraN family protein [Candidatus Nomurabacteria bacterium]|nr:YraN family protein [Candidatus Nomurabacteria bacterium]
MKQFTSETQKIGEIGEKLAEKFLVKQGFVIMDRNYGKRVGEIDIIGKLSRETKIRGDVVDPGIHFMEVKTAQTKIADVPHETGKQYVSRETYNPAQNVDYKKIERMHRTIATYLAENNVSQETLWQIDVISVFLDLETKKAKIEILWNTID